MSKNIRITEPSAEMLGKIIRAREAIAAQKPRYIKCPYAAVLHALNNMDSDLLLIAKDDEFGRKLQDLALPTRRRAPKKGE